MATIIKGKKIFGPNPENIPIKMSFNIHIISEGYSNRKMFENDCTKLIGQLQTLAPFGLISTWNTWMSVYSYYIPSSTAGTIGSNSALNYNRTAFNSYFDTSSNNKKLVIAYQKFIDTISVDNNCEVDGTSLLSVLKRFGSNSFDDSFMPGLAFILVPNATTAPFVPANQIDFVEMEHRNVGDVYFAATSRNSNYHQVLARAIATTIGLADEFEIQLPSTEVGVTYPLSTADKNAAKNYPNLEWFEIVPNTIPTGTGIYSIMDSTQKNAACSTYLHPHIGTQADNNIPPRALVTRRPELWEGGYGATSKIYRSSYDCISRRKIGHDDLRMKSPANFCPLCSKWITKVITGSLMSTRKKGKTLTTQTLKYDDIKWGTQDIQKGNATGGAITKGANTGPSSAGISEPYWSFNAAFHSSSNTGLNGMRLDSVKIKNQSAYVFPFEEDAFKYIDFRNLYVTWDNGSTSDFSIV